MESKVLKQLARAVCSDEKTKQEFLLHPEGLLSQFALTPLEKRAVLSSRARLALANGSTEPDAGPLTAWL